MLKDHQNFVLDLQEKARAILELGPDELTPQEIDTYRYVITDWLDNFVDSEIYQSGSKEGLVSVIVRVLDLVGGKLYEGFSRIG